MCFINLYGILFLLNFVNLLMREIFLVRRTIFPGKLDYQLASLQLYLVIAFCTESCQMCVCCAFSMSLHKFITTNMHENMWSYMKISNSNRKPKVHSTSKVINYLILVSFNFLNFLIIPQTNYMLM